MTQGRRVLKNTVAMIASEAVGSALNLAAIMILGRYMGVTGFGKYAFIMALTGAFQLIADPGLSNILIREIAIDREHLDRHLGYTKSLIWVLSLAAFLLIAATAGAVSPSREMLISTVIAGGAVLAAFHAFGYCSVCRAFEDMEYNAIGFVLHKIALLLFLWGGIKMRVGLIGVNVVYLLAALFLWLYYYIVVRVRYVRPRLHFDLKYWKKMLLDAFPLGIAAVLRKVTWHVDTLILGAIGTAAAVGLFSGAYKVIQGLNLIPLCFALPLFPVFSRLAQTSRESLFSTYEGALKFLLVVSFPLVVFLTVFSERIVTLFLGRQFVEAATALQILAWALLFLFPTSLYVYLFTAMGKQTLFAVSSAACLGINIVLDVILIPRYSFVGACIGTLCAEITLFFVGFYFLRRLGSSLSLFGIAWKPVLAGLGVGIVLYGLKDSSTAVMVAAAAAGFAVYCVMTVVLKTFTREEISAFRNSVVMKSNAVRE